MARPAPAPHFTSEEYFALATRGTLTPDDRVELLEGVIVAMSPQNPRHVAGVQWAADALSGAIGTRAVVRQQFPLIASDFSVPEPDVAVVPGRRADYLDAHPTASLLVVEVADSSLAQDRLTKSRIYAAAGIPEYWIVDLRSDRVEVLRSPDEGQRLYASRRFAGRGEHLDLVALPGVRVAVGDLLPPNPTSD